MKSGRENHRVRVLRVAAAFPLLALAGCTQHGPSNSVAALRTPSAQGSGDMPKVPFGNQPCRSLTAGELKDLGIAKPPPAKPEPGHEPDSLAFDNTCDFGYQSLVYTTQRNYEDQKSELRNPRHAAPGDLPSAFYDVLGNLWFSKKGYYLTIPNNTADAVKEKMARAVAAKL